MLFLESPEQLLCHADGVLGLVLTETVGRLWLQLLMAHLPCGPAVPLGLMTAEADLLGWMMTGVVMNEWHQLLLIDRLVCHAAVLLSLVLTEAVVRQQQ